MIYKSFQIGPTLVSALGDLAGTLGDELRAFKQTNISRPEKILKAFEDACSELHPLCDAVLYIPSNKYGVMSFFAGECARILSLPVWEGLAYTRRAREQKGLESRAERKDNVRGAFTLKSTGFKPSCPLLIDDVYASGETLTEVLSLLEEAGIHPPHAVVFAFRSDFPSE